MREREEARRAQGGEVGWEAIGAWKALYITYNQSPRATVVSTSRRA